MKPDVRNQIINKQNEEADNADLEKETPVAELEKEAREKLVERYDGWFERMRKSKLSIRRSQYLNALTSMLDPHTSNYRPKDKEAFDITFSGRLEGIGATLQSKDEYTRVTTIVGGGPAWKGKELESDDLIMFVRQSGVEEAVVSYDMLVVDVGDFIRCD